MISLEQDIAQSMERAMVWGSFLDRLFAPTEAQLWLEQAAAKLERERDPDGAKRESKKRIVTRLLQRDGHDCWYCGKQLGDDVTIEHLQPSALGGTWNDDNLALAHAGCNKAAGHLTRIKKEALREQMRERQSTPREADVSNKPSAAIR